MYRSVDIQCLMSPKAQRVQKSSIFNWIYLCPKMTDEANFNIKGLKLKSLKCQNAFLLCNPNIKESKIGLKYSREK